MNEEMKKLGCKEDLKGGMQQGGENEWSWIDSCGPTTKPAWILLIHQIAKETKKGGDGVMLGNQVLPSSQNLDGAKQ